MEEDIFEHLFMYTFDISSMYIRRFFWKPEEYVIRAKNGNLEYIERYLMVGKEGRGCIYGDDVREMGLRLF